MAARNFACHASWNTTSPYAGRMPIRYEAQFRTAPYRRFSRAEHRKEHRNNRFLDFEDMALDKGKKLPTPCPSLTQAERYCREKSTRTETETMTATNTSDYFLLDSVIVRRAKQKGGAITPTGCGSSVSFFTNTLLGFSSVDRHAIPFEMLPDRIVSADRIMAGNLPDLYLNVANEDVLIEAQAAVMGEWRGAPGGVWHATPISLKNVLPCRQCAFKNSWRGIGSAQSLRNIGQVCG